MGPSSRAHRRLLLRSLALAREFHRLRLVFRIVEDPQSGVLRSGFGWRKRDPDRALPARRQRRAAVIAHAVRTGRAAVAFHHDRNTALLLAAFGISHGDVLGSIMT